MINLSAQLPKTSTEVADPSSKLGRSSVKSRYFRVGNQRAYPAQIVIRAPGIKGKRLKSWLILTWVGTRKN
jgi:hypothetical protein